MAKVSLNPSSKGVMILIIIAASIFVFCSLGYIAVAGKMRAISADVSAKQKKVAQSQQMAQELEKSRFTFMDTQSQIRFLETSVSSQEFVPTLLRQLEQLALTSGLKMNAITPTQEEKKPAARSMSSSKKASEGNVEAASATNEQPGAAKKPEVKPYDELKIEVEFKGKYTNVLDFLYKLTTFPKILAVKSVTIEPDDRLSYTKPPALKVKMKITAFVLKADDPVTVPGLPQPSVVPVPAPSQPPVVPAPSVSQPSPVPVKGVSSAGEWRGNNEAG